MIHVLESLPAAAMSNEQSGGFGWQLPLPQQVDHQRASTSAQGHVDVCRHFIWGTCKKGTQCKYRHELDPGSMRKLEIFCRPFQQGRCFRTSCVYIHCTKQEVVMFYTRGLIPQALVERHPALLSNSRNIEVNGAQMSPQLWPLVPEPEGQSPPPLLPSNTSPTYHRNCAASATNAYHTVNHLPSAQTASASGTQAQLLPSRFDTSRPPPQLPYNALKRRLDEESEAGPSKGRRHEEPQADHWDNCTTWGESVRVAALAPGPTQERVEPPPERAAPSATAAAALSAVYARFVNGQAAQPTPAYYPQHYAAASPQHNSQYADPQYSVPMDPANSPAPYSAGIHEPKDNTFGTPTPLRAFEDGDKATALVQSLLALRRRQNPAPSRLSSEVMSIILEAMRNSLAPGPSQERVEPPPERAAPSATAAAALSAVYARFVNGQAAQPTPAYYPQHYAAASSQHNSQYSVPRDPANSPAPYSAGIHDPKDYTFRTPTPLRAFEDGDEATALVQSLLALRRRQNPAPSRPSSEVMSNILEAMRNSLAPGPSQERVEPPPERAAPSATAAAALSAVYARFVNGQAAQPTPAYYPQHYAAASPPPSSQYSVTWDPATSPPPPLPTSSPPLPSPKQDP